MPKGHMMHNRQHHCLISFCSMLADDNFRHFRNSRPRPRSGRSSASIEPGKIMQ